MKTDYTSTSNKSVHCNCTLLPTEVVTIPYTETFWTFLHAFWKHKLKKYLVQCKACVLAYIPPLYCPKKYVTSLGTADQQQEPKWWETLTLHAPAIIYTHRFFNSISCHTQTRAGWSGRIWSVVAAQMGPCQSPTHSFQTQIRSNTSRYFCGIFKF